jgi:hypothetical protein
MRRNSTAAVSVVLIVLGLAAIARTLQAGVGGGLGLVLGAMLVAAGACRLYLSSFSRSRPGKARPARKDRQPS